MNLSISLGRNLGLTHSKANEATRSGRYETHFLTIGRLHIIASFRMDY